MLILRMVLGVMGYSHALSGAAAWVALTAVSPVTLGVAPLDPVGVSAGALISAGAALLPDADHHNGTIAHSLPPLSSGITRAVGQVSGGHRHATHSLIGIAAGGGLAFVLSKLVWDIGDDVPFIGGHSFQLGAFILSVLMMAFAGKAIKLTRGWLSSWLFALVTAGLGVWFAPEQTWWLSLAVLVGCFIHVLGDGLTVEGVPWLWPFNPKPVVATTFWKKNGYFALPLLGHAGSAREAVFAFLLGLYIMVALLAAYSPAVAVSLGLG